MSGSVTPVMGMIPIVIPTLTKTWNISIAATPAAMSEPNRSFDITSTRRARDIRPGKLPRNFNASAAQLAIAHQITRNNFADSFAEPDDVAGGDKGFRKSLAQDVARPGRIEHLGLDASLAWEHGLAHLTGADPHAKNHSARDPASCGFAFGAAAELGRVSAPTEE